MGMENGQIRDTQITASSENDENHAAAGEGWTSRPVEVKQEHGQHTEIL